MDAAQRLGGPPGGAAGQAHAGRHEDAADERGVDQDRQPGAEAEELDEADAGFSPTDAVRGLNTIYCYTIGFTIEEQAVHPRPGERDERYDAAKRAERAADLPLVRDTGEEVVGNFDERFEHGLQVIIRGMAPLRGRADP